MRSTGAQVQINPPQKPREPENGGVHESGVRSLASERELHHYWTDSGIGVLILGIPPFRGPKDNVKDLTFWFQGPIQGGHQKSVMQDLRVYLVCWGHMFMSNLDVQHAFHSAWLLHDRALYTPSHRLPKVIWS